MFVEADRDDTMGIKIIGSPSRSVVAALRRSANTKDFSDWKIQLWQRLGIEHAMLVDGDLAQVSNFLRAARR